MKLVKILSAILFSTVMACSLSYAVGESEWVAPLAAILIIGGVILPFVTPGVAMQTICGEITQDLAEDCDNKLSAGVNDRLILINFNDIDSVVRNGANPQIIENIILASGKEAYAWQGKNLSNEPLYTLINNRFVKNYDHEVRQKVFLNTPDAKRELERLAEGLTVAIVENKHKGPSGNSAFEIYGLDVGLEIQEMTRNPNDPETAGAHDALLRTPEESKEPHMPATFFKTDFATTKGLVEALLTP